MTFDSLTTTCITQLMCLTWFTTHCFESFLRHFPLEFSWFKIKKRRLIYTLRHPFPGFSIAKIALFNRSSKETFPHVTKLICKMLHLTAYEVNCLPLTCQMRLTCQGGREGRRVLESGRERSVDGEWCNDGLIHCLYFVLNNFVPFFI